MNSDLPSTSSPVYGLRRSAMVLIDALLVNLSWFLSFSLGFDWRVNQSNLFQVYYLFFLPVSLLRIITFHFCGLYPWSFRYASFSEALRIFRAVSLGSMGLVVLVFFLPFRTVNQSILLVDYLFCLFLILSFRFSPRAWDKFMHRYQKSLKRVLIFGANDCGEMVSRQLLGARHKTHRPIGFIDDDVQKKNLRINGIKVLGNRACISQLISSKRIEEIIIAVPSAPGHLIRDMVNQCQNTEVKIKIVPDLDKILTETNDIQHPREIAPEDLLGRERIQINNKEIKSFLIDKVVLVTGAGGSIGSELCRQVMPHRPAKLILCDQYENEVYFLRLELEKKYPSLDICTIIGDIKDSELLESIFEAHRPHVVFHAAAYKHVPLMEENPAYAVKNNILATHDLILLAARYETERFVMISTDKAVNPTSVMGTTKRIAEMLLQKEAERCKTKFMAVRFGNVIGSNGSVVQLFKRQIADGGPITVTHPDMKRYFMSVDEATQLVLQAGALGKGGEIFVLDMGEQIRILDLAHNLICLSGLRPGRDIAIEMIGLRPGEKLYEEILHDAEHHQATKNEKIYIAQLAKPDSLALARDMEELEYLSTHLENEKIIGKLQEMVPAYKPCGRELKTVNR